MPDANGDSRNSAIKQVASGRFGVTSNYLVNAKELQIKMAQGAKPGEGGQLPGHKVYPWIAKVRALDAGRRPDLAAAAPRHLLHRGPGRADPRPEKRQPSARISVKLVAEVGVGTVAAGRRQGPRRRGPHQRPRRRHRRLAADQHQARRLPWELGLAETQQTLVLNDLRSRASSSSRRPAQDRPRRRHRRPARRRGVRLRHGPAGGRSAAS